MARKQREKSASGIYHVCLRGVNKQRIFEWVEDYEAMYRIIHSAQLTDTMGLEVEVPNFYLYAFCMLDNHVHLLIEPHGFELGEVVKRITVAYAMHFNKRYERVGHLFQDRFKSQPVDDQDYFYELLKYIHNNPVKAEICKTPDRYHYSSFGELCGKITQEGQTPLCNFPPEENSLGLSREDVVAFVKSMPQQSLMERITQEGLTLMCKTLHLHIKQEPADKVDREIVDTLLKMTGVETITEFQRLDKKTMRGALAIVREAGVSIRKLSHLTGISVGIIRYAKNPNNLIEALQEKADAADAVEPSEE